MFLRLFVLIVCFWYLPFALFAQGRGSLIHTIDSLRTNEQVQRFVRRFDGHYSTFFINPPQRVTEVSKDDLAWLQRFGAKQWEKGDFDGNGRTDLLFNGYVCYEKSKYPYRSCFVILDLGKDSFQLIPLALQYLARFFAAKKLTIGNQDYVVTLRYKNPPFNSQPPDKSPKRIDTLMYDCAHFIEYINQPKDFSVRELRFCLWGGSFDLGYSLIIQQDSIQLFVRPSFGSVDSSGTFSVKHDSGTTRKLYKLLQDISIPTLDTHYAVSWTDDCFAVLQIVDNKGNFKRIEDYGATGTYGLAALYDLLKELRHSLHWIRTGGDVVSLPCDF